MPLLKLTDACNAAHSGTTLCGDIRSDFVNISGPRVGILTTYASIGMQLHTCV